jgi:cell wall-associated NlpC family hydrolase
LRLKKVLLIAAAIAVLATVSVVAIASAGGSKSDASDADVAKPATPAAVPAASIDPNARKKDGSSEVGSRARVAVAVAPGQDAPVTVDPTQSTGKGPDAKQQRAASDAEVRQELADFRKYLASQSPAVGGPVAKVLPDGSAVAPRHAPEVVKAIINAGNQIALTPYIWGGGHGAWADTGYDCSGSVSFALAGAGLLESPLTSGAFMNWGEPGPGKWVTIYASNGHVFMYVAGLRFDTSGRGANSDTRWQANLRSTSGFVAVHPPGL